MVRRAAIDAVGWYDPHVLMKRLCDWDLWRRIARRYPLVFVDRDIAIEHGTALTHSLGRSVTVDMDLVMPYVQTDRDARLAPGALVEADCYRIALGMPLSPAQAASLDRQLFDHALATDNTALARTVAQRMASSPPPEGEADAGLVNVLGAAAQLVRARTATMAEREIELETRVVATLGVADAHARELAEVQAQLRAAVATGEAFRTAADVRAERVAMLEAALASLETALATANAIGSEFRAAADARMELIHALEQQLVAAQGDASDARDELAGARKAHAAEVVRNDAMADEVARMADALAAARFRIDEAQRVEASWLGGLAFWLQRVLGR
jgi:hypothetical protein